jgi:hypothetical protein
MSTRGAAGKTGGRKAQLLVSVAHVVVVELDTEEVLVKRLLRGSRAGLYDLESIAGPTRQDARLRWAAHITAIVPPFQARRIIRGAA